MSFRAVFIALVIGFALIVGAFLINRHRPRVETEQPTAALRPRVGEVRGVPSAAAVLGRPRVRDERARAEGRELSRLPSAGHGQQKTDHHGFVISTALTAGNCRSCHEGDLPAVPAQPARRARRGRRSTAQQALTPEQVAFAEQFQPGGVQRPPHPLAVLEGRLGGDQRLRAVPQRRQAQRRRHDRHLHRLPHPAHLLGRARPPADDLRPVPHGAGPLADRDLRRSRSTASCSHAQRAAAQPRRARQDADHARHVRADLRHLPHERPQRPEGHPRPVRAPVLLPGRRDHRNRARTHERAQAA